MVRIRNVKIDKEKCLGCGACVSICEKGLRMKDGKAEIKDKNAKCINEAISACPVDAIIENKKRVKK